jgi:hypothetical protein
MKAYEVEVCKGVKIWKSRPEDFEIEYPLDILPIEREPFLAL